MKNFLAILGCFSLAIIMIVVFASCGNKDKDDVVITDPDSGITEEEKDTEKDDTADTEEADDRTEEDTNEATEEDPTAEKTSSTGSSFLDTVLGGVEDIVGEALGGAADVVENALSGAADKVNNALSEENE